MIVVINGCTIDIAMMRKPPKTWQELPDTKRLVSITTDHTLKSGMKGNFHVPFGIGGGGGKPVPDHTGTFFIFCFRGKRDNGLLYLRHTGFPINSTKKKRVDI